MKRRHLTYLAAVLPLFLVPGIGRTDCGPTKPDPEGLRACFDYRPQNPGEKGWIYFDASSSEGDPGTYSWTFEGLDKELQGVTAHRSFPSSGTYEVTLTVGKESDDCVFDFCTARVTRTIEVLDELPSCTPTPQSACLNGQRFRIEARWWTRDGNSGDAKALRMTDNTGYFWFFEEDNVEIVVKVLDGVGADGHYRVYYGSLTDVGFELTVTDTETGNSKAYRNEPGRFASVGDVRALPQEGPDGRRYPSMWVLDIDHVGISPGRELARGTVVCEPSETRLCLSDRFALEVEFEDHGGNEGNGRASPLTEETGYFWFFDEDNVEIVTKVLDGRSVNGKFWVFYASLTDVEFDLTVTDLMTGNKRAYHNEPGHFVSSGDINALERR